MSPRPRRMSVAVRVPRGGISRRKGDVIALVSSLQKEATETRGDGQRGARPLTGPAPH